MAGQIALGLRWKLTSQQKMCDENDLFWQLSQSGLDDTFGVMEIIYLIKPPPLSDITITC